MPTATSPPATPAPSTSPSSDGGRPSCRPTTPSSPATTACTPSARTLKTAGTQSITATDTVNGSITGTRAAITVNPAAAATLIVVDGTPARHRRHRRLVTVTAQDAFSNVATGYTGHGPLHHYRRRQPPCRATTTSLAGDNGTHTFTTRHPQDRRHQTITATDTVTGTITGTRPRSPSTRPRPRPRPSPGLPSRSPPATRRRVTVTALDAFGNIATGYTGTVHFTSTDGAAALPGNYTFTGGDAGVHTFRARTRSRPPARRRSPRPTPAPARSPARARRSRSTRPRQCASRCRRRPPRRPAPPRASRSPRGTPTATSRPATSAPSTSARRTAAATLPGDYTFTAGDAGVHIFTVDARRPPARRPSPRPTPSPARSPARARDLGQPGLRPRRWCCPATRPQSPQAPRRRSP